MKFCNDYFGCYIHHYPNVFDTMPLPREESEKDAELLLPYIYDHLGQETVCVWFEVVASLIRRKDGAKSTARLRHTGDLNPFFLTAVICTNMLEDIARIILYFYDIYGMPTEVMIA